jgi:hypothetical protein
VHYMVPTAAVLIHHPSLACSRVRAYGWQAVLRVRLRRRFSSERAHVPDRRRVSTVAAQPRRWRAAVTMWPKQRTLYLLTRFETAIWLPRHETATAIRAER